MRTAATLSLTALLAGLPVFASGCVQQNRYDQLLQANRSLQEQNVALADERDSAMATLETMREQLAAARGDVDGLRTRNQGLTGELDGMASEYDKLLARVSSLEFGPLPADVESALQQLAAAYPHLLSFDAKRGMLRFSSDFTFALGSAALQPEAATTISALADILTSESARQFEVRVVGHTDNVPIGKPETRQRHPTNVHLSVHRAITVRDALVSAGVAPVRIQVAGYGEFRPIVANGPRGEAANRRVEVFLLPMPDVPQSVPATDIVQQPDLDEPLK